jgi:hypothetical protein
MQISTKCLWLEETLRLRQPSSHYNKPLPGVCGWLCCHCCGMEKCVWGCIHKRFILCCATSRSGPNKSEKKIAELKEKCKSQEQQELLPTGKALIVFNYESHAKNMLRDHNRMPRNRYLRMLLQSLLTYSTLRRFHRGTCARPLYPLVTPVATFHRHLSPLFRRVSPGNTCRHSSQTRIEGMQDDVPLCHRKNR